MSIKSNLEGIRKLSNSSLTSIVDVTNLNFKTLSEANLQFLNDINYNEVANSISINNGTFDNISISNTISLELDGIPTFTINSKGKAEGQELLVILSESKRHRFTDFNDWPDEGVPGEVIYTGVQNQKPEFGEDFIGYLDGQGWVSLTSLNRAIASLSLLVEAGSPVILPNVPIGQGILWLGPTGLQNNYDPSNTTVYFSDDEGNHFDILTDFAWEIVGDDAKFKPIGKAIIGDVSTPKILQYIDGNQAPGYILTSDGFGNASWTPNLGSAAPGPVNYSYWEIASFIADVPKTIVHGLQSINLVVDFIDTITNEKIDAHVDNYQSNSIDVTLPVNNSNVKVVIMASGAALQINQETISVDAVGDSTYVGTAYSPGISQYKSDVIYLVKFSLNNIGASTLDIDTLGAYPIEKGTISGFISLSPNDIIAGLIYYIVWDGTRFQFFSSNPGFSPLNYTNLNPTPQTIGGISSGSTFTNQTMQEMWDNLLYPFQIPNFITFSMSGQSTVIEVGDTVNNTGRTFIWSTTNSGSIQPNTIKIQNITGGTIDLITGSANDGSELVLLPSPITKTTPVSHLWKILATRTNASTMTKNYQIDWRWRRFWGTSINSVLNESQIEALIGQSLSTSMSGTFSLAAGGYKYFCVPTTFAHPSLIKDQLTNLSIAMADTIDGYTSSGSGPYKFQIISITNSFGIVQNYRLYRSKNTLGGSITIVVS